MTELIITEKPAASKKIAEALSDGKVDKFSEKTVPYYKITRKGKDIVVGCAVGHLYGLAEKDKNGWNFPVFDVEWRPVAEVNPNAKFSDKYIQVLKKLSKEASEFTVATDYDIEGEVIGLNVVRFICKKKDANRMKFSTLTKPDLIKAYENKAKTLDWGQANAGETRHEMDWYYGINLSRALTSAIKEAGMFKILSIGRVQGPALKIIVDREREIKAFKPVPFWQIQLLGRVKQNKIEAWHKKDKFWKKEEAEQVMKNVKDVKKGKVTNVEKKQFKQNAPFPFDLTALQIEAYRCLKIAPKDTLAIAQDLYTSGLISYPRTSSQVLPKEIGYSKIISLLAKQKEYSELCKGLLKGALRPNNGKKTDPAHPAIYPTGLVGKLDGRQRKIYDLIARRFLATFGPEAVRETVTVDIDVNKEIFVAKGVRTIEKGWHIYYAPYVKLEEIELPLINRGDIVDIDKIKNIEKETQPPKRYTPASIIKELEKRNLGTKATRAAIVDTLFQRDYVTGKAIGATDLGIRTIEVLEKNCPKIIDEELTRHFEFEMDQIREKKKKEEEVLGEAKEILTKILGDFKDKEKGIGKGLMAANIEARDKANTMGKCPNCKDGILMVRKGKFGRFGACSNYPKCKTTFKLPAMGFIQTSDKVCKECEHPLITMIRKGKKPQEVCINPECPSKEVKVKEGRKCPKCSDGKLVLRKSVYGAFLGCSNYPKCRYTEKIN